MSSKNLHEDYSRAPPAGRCTTPGPQLWPVCWGLWYAWQSE